jgi:hypothetical protein
MFSAEEKIAWNITKICVDACLPMGHPKLFSNFNSKKLVKVETPRCVFSRLGIKVSEISS